MKALDPQERYSRFSGCKCTYQLTERERCVGTVEIDYTRMPFRLVCSHCGSEFDLETGEMVTNPKFPK